MSRLLISLGLIEPVLRVKVVDRHPYYATKGTSLTTGLSASIANNLRFVFGVEFEKRISLSLWPNLRIFLEADERISCEVNHTSAWRSINVQVFACFPDKK